MLLRKLGFSCRALSYRSLRLLTTQASILVEEMVETRRTPRMPTDVVSLNQAIANLRRHHSNTTASTPVSSKHAAVLIPLFESEGEIHVILTQRSSKLRKHAGEVCFPGGKQEDGDANDVATALREAHEELGIDPGCVNVIVSMPPVLSKHLLSVTPVIATVPSDLRFIPSPSEVDHVFSAPLSMFLEAGPGYSHRDVQWEGLPYRLHYWEYRYKDQNFLIWGLTAGILVVAAEQALGRSAAFPVHPPGAMPYTALAFESGKLVFRGGGGGGSSTSANSAGDNREGTSAAVPGAFVTEAEMVAAVGEDEDDIEEEAGDNAT
jgi:8-oxo-dGTP pyrophosphatase MutT (NUDIX family)